MAIEITLVDGEYTATVSPPHSSTAWSSDKPMSADELDARLRELGCHPTDIGDAFYEADPAWVQRTSR
jgi:hypothetical protein